MYAVAFLIATYAALYVAMIFCAALQSNLGFGLTLRLLVMAFPFSNTKPEIPSAFAWAGNVLFFVGVASSAGAVVDVSKRLRLALTVMLFAVGGGVLAEQLLLLAGFRRYFSIDL